MTSQTDHLAELQFNVDDWERKIHDAQLPLLAD
jgi:hypothetical protein